MSALCMGVDFNEELACSICLDSWKDPQELTPCGHIICKECIAGQKTCPLCRGSITSYKPPNRTLVNMALNVKVKCAQCGWTGTRESSEHHKCDGGGGTAAPNPSPSPSHVPSKNNSNGNAGNNSSSGSPPPSGGFGNFSSGVPSSYTPSSAQQSQAAPARPPKYQPPPQPQPQPSYSQQQRPTYPPQPPQQPGPGYMAPSPGYPQQNPGYMPPNPGYALPSPGYMTPSPGYTSPNPGYPQQSPGYQQQRPGYQQPSPMPQAGGRTGAPRRYNVIEPTGPRPWTNYSLTQEEYDEILSLFVFFDDDDTQELNRVQAGRLARWLNFATTPAAVEDMFRAMDADGNGSLSLGEFLTFLKYNKPDPSSLYGLSQGQYHTVMMQFHMYDADRDGQLDINEFTQLLMRLGDVRDPVQAQNIFRRIDRNGDGVVNLHEFLLFRAGKH